MALVEVLLPAMGEGIIEATLISWSKNIGEPIAIDENLVEVATDKVNSEVPSTASGTLHKKLFNDNDVVPIGTAFAIISTEGDENDAVTPKEEPTKKEPEVEKIVANEMEKIEATISSKVASDPIFLDGDRFYSPLVLNIAKEEGISKNELATIQGSGHAGRLTKDDIVAYLSTRGLPPVSTAIKTSTPEPIVSATATPTSQVEKTVNFGPNIEVIKMDRTRKLIGDHMIKSVQTSTPFLTIVL
ncbi:MAG: biotin/lipoyl-containing protein [Chitinophagales bacterium]